jgi:hypothetical protein
VTTDEPDVTAMSNGWYRFARIDNDNGHIVVDDGWGSYEGVTVSIFAAESADRFTGSQEIRLTHEQWAELLQQLNEYHINTIGSAGAGRIGQRGSPSSRGRRRVSPDHRQVRSPRARASSMMRRATATAWPHGMTTTSGSGPVEPPVTATPSSPACSSSWREASSGARASFAGLLMAPLWNADQTAFHTAARGGRTV